MRIDRLGQVFGFVAVLAAALGTALALRDADYDDLVAPLGALAFLNGLLFLQRSMLAPIPEPSTVAGADPRIRSTNPSTPSVMSEVFEAIRRRATSALAAVLLLSVVLMVAWLLFNFLLLAPDPAAN